MDNKLLNIILLVLKFALGGFGVILFFLLISTEDMEALGGYILTGVGITEAAIVICTAVALIFGIWQIATNVKKSIPILGGIAAFLVIFGISYAMADATPMMLKGEAVEISTIKWTSTGINMLYILLGLVVATALFSEVKKIIQ